MLDAKWYMDQVLTELGRVAEHATEAYSEYIEAVAQGAYECEDDVLNNLHNELSEILASVFEASVYASTIRAALPEKKEEKDGEV